ncbi:MAG: threonine synthase [Negativicutes bacterium]|nr:threonine synthase [Negativicutes bacterium]
MHYVSTRGGTPPVPAIRAIADGMAGDGGLYLPDVIPPLRVEWGKWQEMAYAERAAAVLGQFLPEFCHSEMQAICTAAYRQFDHPAVAPLVMVGERPVLELWHGPTAAFKDMALTVMPRLLSASLVKLGDQRTAVVLTATSGDTGKAALTGFADVPGTKILVFYPRHGISAMQRRQMVSQPGDNVNVVAVDGNFDDCQTGVKDIFADRQLAARLDAAGFFLSSANSINWGRLVPQVAYYFSAYAELLAQGVIADGQPVNFAVPTGNFGNILAGYLAKLSGLPVHRLICASNSNNILHDFITSGTYDCRRQFHRTLSPSMDILLSSNLERLLYLVAGSPAVSGWMSELRQKGCYRVDDRTRQAIGRHFVSQWAGEEETLATMRTIWQKHRYMLDPHTAVAWRAVDRLGKAELDGCPTVVLSTASPFKFNPAVATALLPGQGTEGDEFSLMDKLAALSGWVPPPALTGLKTAAVRFDTVCSRDGMSNQLENWLLGGCRADR